MSKTLIIAEKPSVATAIAKALGGFKKADEYFESDQFVLSSAVGHLLTIVPPEGVEAARGKWTFKCLPVIPVVVASGRMEDAVAGEFKTLGVTSRLDKPFTEVQLAEALKNLLTPK